MVDAGSVLPDELDRPSGDEAWAGDGGAAPPPGPGRGRRRRLFVASVVVAALVVALVAGGALWVKGRIDPPGAPGAEVRVEIPIGSSTPSIADQLEAAGVVADATVFRLYLRLRGGGPFQAGSYTLQRRSSMSQVLGVLNAGPSLPPTVKLTIPEGLIVAQVAQRVDTVDQLDPAAFLAAASDGSVRSAYEPVGSNNLEGLLFPETYRIAKGDDERALLHQMVNTFEQVADELGLANAPQLVGVSPYEAVIVASLVEAEAKSDADRPKIARVIYNRLAARMPLGIDAAFYYALPLDRRGTALRQSELDRDGPYNTRTRVGLVPTPIMAPGRASLAAALAPEPGPWLYYVLKDQTTHAFSATYDDFLRNKAAAEKAGLIP